jgi:hypothetical protein
MGIVFRAAIITERQKGSYWIYIALLEDQRFGHFCHLKLLLGYAAVAAGYFLQVRA